MHARKISAATWRFRLEKGGEIPSQVAAFCLEQVIRPDHFTGSGRHGGVSDRHFPYMTKKRCIGGTYHGNSEIIALQGSITTVEGPFYLQAHLGAGPADLSMAGGRLNKAIVDPTCELILHSPAGIIDRFLDPDSGSNLLKTEDE